MNSSRAADALLAFVRGGTESNLRDAGIEVSVDGGGRVRVETPASVPTVAPSERDIALGFTRASTRGDLDTWASLLLAVSNIQLDALNLDSSEVLLNALWDAAAGDPLSDAAVRRLREIANYERE